MTESTESRPADDDVKRLPHKKEINPFSEQEKHGEPAQRRDPQSDQEAQGNTVQPHTAGAGDDAGKTGNVS
jgi:hypothetical protein